MKAKSKKSPTRYVYGNKAGGMIHPQLIIAGGIVIISTLAVFAHTQMESRINMARTHANFTGALKIAENNLNARLSGKSIDLPNNTGEWIELFNAQAESAPGGGPAFIVNNKGNSDTGAIGVSSTNFGSELHITRPAYAILAEHKSVIKSPEKET